MLDKLPDDFKRAYHKANLGESQMTPRLSEDRETRSDLRRRIWEVYSGVLEEKIDPAEGIRLLQDLQSEVSLQLRRTMRPPGEKILLSDCPDSEIRYFRVDGECTIPLGEERELILDHDTLISIMRFETGDTFFIGLPANVRLHLAGKYFPEDGLPVRDAKGEDPKTGYKDPFPDGDNDHDDGDNLQPQP